jgi:hypothetical protein
MDHTREVPIGATETIRIVCKETLQSLVTTFTNMELEIRVKRPFASQNNDGGNSKLCRKRV